MRVCWVIVAAVSAAWVVGRYKKLRVGWAQMFVGTRLVA